MSTALSHLPDNWPDPGPEISDALSVSGSLSDAEMLEEAWAWARLDGQFGEALEGLFEADEEVL